DVLALERLDDRSQALLNRCARCATLSAHTYRQPCLSVAGEFAQGRREICSEQGCTASCVGARRQCVRSTIADDIGFAYFKPTLSPMDLLQLTIAASVLVLWAAALLWRDGFAPPRLAKPTIKFTHVLPATLQSTLFAYWSMYWPEVFEHVPILGVQLAIAYAFDLLLAWTLRRPYSFGFGPVPVVLSANLFVWFQPGDVLLYALMIALALSSKAFIRVDGRHIFNPSVFGITIVALLCILLPHIFHYRDIAHDFDRPPHMALVIIA